MEWSNDLENDARCILDWLTVLYETAVTKSGTGTWDMRTQDAGTRDAGMWDAGTWDAGTWDSGMPERGDSGTSERKDVINKEHMNFALNLQFTILGGQEKGIVW